MTMGDIQLEFGSASPCVNFIGNIFSINIGSLLHMLAQNCDKQYGFNYELGSGTRQYYSNVHATVLLNLFASHLLNNEESEILRDALFRLRDSNPNTIYEKTEEDKYAWDVIEGPSAFSTSLACYSLLLSRDSRVKEIEKSIKWLLGQRNNKEIWPTFKKGESNNYVTTLYSVLTLRL